MEITKQSIHNRNAIIDEVLDYIINGESAPSNTPEWLDFQPGLEPLISVFQIECPKLHFEWNSSNDCMYSDINAERVSFHALLATQCPMPCVIQNKPIDLIFLEPSIQ